MGRCVRALPPLAACWGRWGMALALGFRGMHSLFVLSGRTLPLPPLSAVCLQVRLSVSAKRKPSRQKAAWFWTCGASGGIMRRPTLSRILITCALALGALATQQAPEAPLEPRAPALVPTDEAPVRVEEQSAALEQPLGKRATGEHSPPSKLPPVAEDAAVAPSEKKAPPPHGEVVPADEPAQLDGATTRGDGDNGATEGAAPSTVPVLVPYPWPVLNTAALEPGGEAEAAEVAAEGSAAQEAGLANAEAEEREPPEAAAEAPADASESAAGVAAQPDEVAAVDAGGSLGGSPEAAGAELAAGDLPSEAQGDGAATPTPNESAMTSAVAAPAEDAEGETTEGRRDEAPEDGGGGGGEGSGGEDGGGEGGEEDGEEDGGPEEPMIPSLEKWKEQALQRLQSDAMKAGLRGDAAAEATGQSNDAAAGLDAGLSEGGAEARGPETFVRPTKPLKDRFNYLSSTAGAKVLAANVEMQNDRNILSEDKDKYMMT